MDRYQFEDLISAYIENELSLSKRKEVESYLAENPSKEKLIKQVSLNMKTLKNKVQSIFTLMFLTLMFSAGALADTPEAPENLKVIPDNWDQNGYVYLVADHEGDNDEYTYKVYRAEGRTDELSAFSALSEDEYEVYQTDTLKI